MQQTNNQQASTDRIVWTFFAVLVWLATFLIVLVVNPLYGLVVLGGSVLLLLIFLRVRSRRKKKS